MKQMFVVDGEFERKVSRARAKGYKSLVIADDVEHASYIDIETDGTDLVMKAVEDDESDNAEVYVMLVKEFGLFGLSSGLKSKLSVIFLDNGYMLVTLYKGAIITYLNGEICIPNVEQDTFPNFAMDDIYWVNQEALLSYSKFMGEKGNFMYDFEFHYTLGGDIKNGLSNFSFHHDKEEDIDISLGLFSAYLDKLEKKEDARNTKKLANLVKAGVSSFSDDDFDDDFDDDDDDDDFDDDSEDDEFF